MDKTPTETKTSDPVEAVNSDTTRHVLLPIRVEPDLAHLASTLAETMTLNAELAADDGGAAQLAAIVHAAATAYRRGDTDWLRQIGGKGAHYVQQNTGARTRAQEADMLCRRIERGLEKGATLRQIAEAIVAILRIAPKLAIHTRVPLRGAWIGTEAQESAISAVERQLELARSKDPERLSKVALRALEYPADRAKNLFRHRNP